MFDVETANLLRSAPGMPGLDPKDIPALLTRHYAELSSARLRGEDPSTGDGSEWDLHRIADTYEVVAALHDGQLRRASAFVAATAQQILARREVLREPIVARPNLTRDRVSPTLTAALLFLVAEQYADANEAASNIKVRPEGAEQLYEATILSEHIFDLARGRLNSILSRRERIRRSPPPPSAARDIDERALAALLDTLNLGIEIFAATFLREPLGDAPLQFGSARQAFDRVIELSGAVPVLPEGLSALGAASVVTYAGPYHAASLLRAAVDGLEGASLMTIPPPDGADGEVWDNWLRKRSREFPYVWPNHRKAVEQRFHERGVSAVVVLPTGAGKTTLSSLKIAGTLARNQKVAFLAPTHALVDQLTSDLKKMFPKDVFDAVVSSDFDLLFQSEANFQDIEIMTPERCLAMLSFAPESFADVGLMVFDECHLLSPQSGKIRRALDSMLCVLGFNHVAPKADFLFLSAMVENGNELAQWLGDLTGREAVSVDLLWKPSRQARGVVVYQGEELRGAEARATAAQQAGNTQAKKKSGTVRAAAKRELSCTPYAIWGLQHNWIDDENDSLSLLPSKLLETPVQLGGGIWRTDRVYSTPNANGVAAQIAVAAARNNLKTIVFVNSKRDAVNVAAEISDVLGEALEPDDIENERWQSLEVELGDLKHSILSGPSLAVPHNSLMLPFERELSERMFNRADGAKVIVATPTLAQGLNLPANLAILAGDKRTSEDGREDLEAHEILNAAARAGRAGHLANGLVLLIPDPNQGFILADGLDERLLDKLSSILPENDHCVVITDPLTDVLDRLSSGLSDNRDVRYTINRMSSLKGIDAIDDPTQLFNLHKSLGAFQAKQKASEKQFEEKVELLIKAIADEKIDGTDDALAILASQSGLPVSLLMGLRKRIGDDIAELPVTISGWVTWMTTWLIDEPEARGLMLGDVEDSLLSICGKKKGGALEPADLELICAGVLAWIEGEPLRAIEFVLGGNPDVASDAQRICPRARLLVGTVIPRGYSFIIGLVGHVVMEVSPFEERPDLDPKVVECLGAAVRKGFDTVDKLLFPIDETLVIGRVQQHQAYAFVEG